MLKTTVRTALAAALALAIAPTAFAVDPFDEIEMYLEYNATDDDGEIVIKLNSDDALKLLHVFAPNGRKIINFRSNDSQDLGVREFLFESAEPSLGQVLQAYPEGIYRFVGRTVDNQMRVSHMILSHDLPDAPVITNPAADANNVPVDDVVATWDAVPGAQGYLIELEQEGVELEQSLELNVPGTTTSFAFPNGWLENDRPCQFGVAAIAANGNITVTEIEFTTEQ